MAKALLIETGLAATQRLLNGILRKGDQKTLQQLTALAGRSIEIDVSDSNLTLYILFGREGIELLRQSPGEISTTIRGRLMALRQLAGKGQGMPAEVTIEGDVDLAQRLQTVIDELSIDWEEILSQGVGDVVAHSFLSQLRRASRYRQTVDSNLRQDLHDYLLEEARLLPQKDETENLVDDIDRFRARIDRTQARLNRLNKLFRESGK